MCHQSCALYINENSREIQSVDVLKHFHIDVKLTAKSANKHTFMAALKSFLFNLITSHHIEIGMDVHVQVCIQEYLCKFVLMPFIIHKLRNYNAQWPLHFTVCVYRSRQYRFEKQWELVAKSKWTLLYPTNQITSQTTNTINRLSMLISKFIIHARSHGSVFVVYIVKFAFNFHVV